MGIVTNVTNAYQTCIDACNRCAQACWECFEACLNEADIQARLGCIKMLAECAQMCSMSAAGMASNGKFIKEHCSLCATVCDDCAKECDMFTDQHCKQCAQVCRTCAQECRDMAMYVNPVGQGATTFQHAQH
jgi:hypothetical protein